jgi:hypothetical protein
VRHSERWSFEQAPELNAIERSAICRPPRAAEIPHAVARYLGEEVYPGENILDESGNRVGHTRTLFTETNAGGRAAFALESVAAMDYIFGVQNVVVVHHSFCGTTTLTPELLIEEFHDHYHADITTMFDHDSLAIMDFEMSLKHDVALLGLRRPLKTESGSYNVHVAHNLVRLKQTNDIQPFYASGSMTPTWMSFREFPPFRKEHRNAFRCHECIFR